MQRDEVLKLIEEAARTGQTELDLRENQLTELPAEIGELKNLTKLNLSGNKISQLPTEIGKLTNLTELNLNGNKISQLSAEIGKLTNLTRLNLSRNKINQLPAEIGKLTNLTRLYLSGNKISQLPAEISELTNLIGLYLSGNKINQLPAEIGKLTNLTRLNLSRNKISQLPAEIGELTNLTRLDLSRNQISQLPVEITKLTNLTGLNLSWNKISQLPTEITKLTNLIGLDLSWNQISQLPAEIGELANLTELNLGMNKISQLPAEITKLTNLTRLDLSENKISQLPAEIGELTNLPRLDLSRNQISQLPAEITKLTNLTGLNLSWNKISQLPAEIGELTNLTRLNLSRNKISQLPAEIGKLTNLTTLSLNDIQISQLPAEIGKLTNLTMLDLNWNQISQLPAEIGKLTNLTTLYLGVNKIKQLPVEIGKLTNLTRLILSKNQISQLPAEIGKLTNLTTLSLSGNQISQLPAEIGKLTNLTRLDLSGNQISQLPVEIGKLTNLTNHASLNLSGNPLKSPPPEIAARGIQAIFEYFKSLEAERQPLNEVKVLLVGDGGAGKTSLVKRLRGEKFDNNEPQTHGINIKKWEIIDGDDKIKVHSWDFGGQEIMHATHQFFLSKRSLYVLVLDGRKEEKTEYWLKHIESFGGDSPILVVINKIDENPSFDVNRPFLQDKYKGIKSFHRVSCKENEGIASFDEILTDVLTKVELRQEPFAKSWFNVKTKLEDMTDNFISYENFQELCIQESITGESAQDTLIGFLNDLGIILHFKDFQLKHTHVLEPKWVTGAVYRIINSEKVAQNHGVLKLKSLDGILKKDKETDYFYPQDKHKYIIDLMKKFELCYEIGSDCILIPDLLEIQEPKFDFDYSSSLKFLIDYDFLPKSVMPRFIVKMHKDIKNNLRWRTGVALEDPTFNSTAVVKADENDKKIYIFVNGNQKKDYFSVILYNFRKINKNFEKMKAIERVPLPNEPEITVSYEHLIRLERKGIETHNPDGSENEYNVKELLGTVYVENKNEEKILQLLRKLVDKFDTEESLLEKANGIVMLQPNAFGIGMNINELVKKVIKRHK